MGLLRRKPRAGERAAAATREAAVDASERVHTAAVQTAEFTKETADLASEKLHRRAESASRRAEKAGRRAARTTRRAVDSGTHSVAAAANGLLTEADLKARSADRKTAKTAAKADAGARKAEAKAAQAAEKGRLKSEARAAKDAERERAAREWNAKRVQRYLGIAKIVAPLVAPYAMAAAGTLRHRLDDHRSRRLGVSPDELGGYSGPGGKLHARLSRISRTIAELRADGTTDRDANAKRFADETEPRLHDLAAAVRAAENMPAARRKAAFRTISHDLDRIEVELLDHLGVRA
ncbi:hypothetical protein Ae168Ps1_3543c [Pseudonocardia sp. Ae168_Ps1]|uniref:DUF6474 family protein n=1 Tax=unclassified Pseudonocardia TaxID=2619320 RepID=UPI000967503D|nr:MULTISPECIES: DUF6474 family protein [unclassified Pseudonocardia]OLL75143.1 hypothetical protein Ae150APs1_3521c [Pseudonocardia sp. Ae150A_Ps1]OLL81137.1 hypothetical protein Ae168Ps1_3543c [Pseudonocardia sp. Ae168_Ps1]OLL84748.1 hypothetical protein Ae263Ps1_1803 [Pseudonocardia sp. Ae263_Ps1]OLL95235.1 hypothetical protein Ae356Ps1_5132c [Pseudonocardia sp. Ae356_Ps1]